MERVWKDIIMQKHLTVKDLPDMERPYEKCMANGAESLSDAELISVIIRTGSHGEKSVDLANRILNAGSHGVLNLIYLSMPDLKKIKGIGTVKAIQLKCAAELSKRLSMASRYQEAVLDSAASIAGYYMERLRHEKKEISLLTMFNTRNILICDEVISVGTSNASLMSPSEIFRTSLLKGAEYIVLLHNHPSGNPRPSTADQNVTLRLKECGSIIGIPLMDHIIIGDNQYFSFKEHNIL